MRVYIRAAGDLFLTIFIKAPLLAIVAAPAFALGYLWVVAKGAFIAGTIIQYEEEN